MGFKNWTKNCVVEMHDEIRMTTGITNSPDFADLVKFRLFQMNLLEKNGDNEVLSVTKLRQMLGLPQ